MGTLWVVSEGDLMQGVGVVVVVNNIGGKSLSQLFVIIDAHNVSQSFPHSLLDQYLVKTRGNIIVVGKCALPSKSKVH